MLAHKDNKNYFASISGSVKIADRVYVSQCGKSSTIFKVD